MLSGDPERKIRAGWEVNVSRESRRGEGNLERFARGRRAPTPCRCR